MIEQGLFREDLFYRLNVVPIRIPPLRERLEDIPDLVRHFLSEGTKEGLDQKTFDRDAMERMKRYAWPGNVRELENLVRRLAALYAQDTITGDVIESELASARPSLNDGAVGDREVLGDGLESYLQAHFREYGEALPPPGLYNRILRKVEVPLITTALAATRGNQIKAAEVLGLNRNTLRKKIRELDIKVIRSSA